MTRNEVVVGLDPSASARAALRWAAQYARVTYTDLRAVHILSWPFVSPAWAVGFDEPGGLPAGTAEESAAVEALYAGIHPEKDWALEHFSGAAGPRLVEQAQEAQLLVIGTGTHSALSRALFGSVSRYCLGHARCPVVAVHVEGQAVARGPASQSRAPQTWRTQPNG
jgi:nucleotide-binding universal stress UspA family protein